jgi:hypothetical protein
VKIRRPSLAILLAEVDELESIGLQLQQLLLDVHENGTKLKQAASEWIAVQEERDEWGSYDQEWAQIHRNSLENTIILYRRKLAEVYDYMGDRGLM